MSVMMKSLSFKKNMITSKKFSCDLMLNKQHKNKDIYDPIQFETPMLIGKWDDDKHIFTMKKLE